MEHCTKTKGCILGNCHLGDCVVKQGFWSRLGQKIGEAIGQSKFGG